MFVLASNNGGWRFEEQLQEKGKDMARPSPGIQPELHRPELVASEAIELFSSAGLPWPYKLSLVY